jgi:hypothetical protein
VIRKLIYSTFAALLLIGTAIAQDVSVRSDHPDEYVVVKGDTLWDISGRFLDKPWQWPAIWHVNPQIENPHLIFPGDVISLVYIDGMPQLRLQRGGTKKLSPSVRVTDREAVNAVPFDKIKPFIRNVRVLSPEEFDGLPYVVANNEQRMNAAVSDHAYGRGLNAQVGQEFVVARLSSIYDDVGDGQIRRVLPKDGWRQVPNIWDRQESTFNTVSPWNRRPKNPVGYEMIEVSRVRVSQAGEISVLDVLGNRTEVKPGDFILPDTDPGYDPVFYPSAMDTVPDGLRVLATSGQRAGVGLHQIVSISGGSRDGIQPGHVFAAFRKGDRIADEVGFREGSFSTDAQVRLPDTFDGVVMVFRTFDFVSYAMVMGGDRVVQEFDVLRHPDTRP